MDPRLTKDGKPYGPYKYKDLVKLRFIISKYCNTSYTDLGKITPTEREYLIEFILDYIQQENDALASVTKSHKK